MSNESKAFICGMLCVVGFSIVPIVCIIYALTVSSFTDYSDSYGQELFAKLYLDWGKRYMNTPPKKLKYTGSRTALRELKKARG